MFLYLEIVRTFFSKTRFNKFLCMIFWSLSNFLPYPANRFYGRPFFPLPRRWRWISRPDLNGVFVWATLLCLFFKCWEVQPWKNSLHVRFRISVSFFFKIWIMFFSFVFPANLVGFKLECALDVPFQRCIGWKNCSFPREFPQKFTQMKLGKLDFGKMAEDHFGWWNIFIGHPVIICVFFHIKISRTIV